MSAALTTGAAPVLEALRSSMDGVVPAVMTTVSAAGVPNVAYLSQVEYVDPQHVALSFQFFNRTRANVLATRRAVVLVVDPVTAQQARLHIEYDHTEDSGPLFERMRAKLAGIASHTGMDGVFRLLGSDVYRVRAIELVPGRTLPPAPPRCARGPLLRSASEHLAACSTLEALIDETMACLRDRLGLPHALLLLADPSRQRLYTVASFGYAGSGLGSEIEWGQGIIGVAARERSAIRIGHATTAYRYARAMRDAAAASGLADPAHADIPLPGLADARSQLAVPLLAGGRVQGVLFVESTEDLFFDYDDEDLLATLGTQIGAGIALLQSATDVADDPSTTAVERTVPSGPPLVVRHFAPNDSVFLDDDYLVKGVAGAIFWKLARSVVDEGRDSFSNRELRLDARLGLPEVADNLEARLILLARRLDERGAGVRIEKTGRGRFRLDLQRSLKLVELPVG
ncbi:GAF domain-containing protein [Rivibacter subsaxonicus]|uniref:GAF domain-containing protein n=1 Tax=Rivibacter subsaxonicus TaxID=457575 RepID=A0A4Q7VZ49_9BURK|nr:GAF domain-containing protein [Rivibacter subsaxonicus]RZU02000.1 GAF domain-containing protein [Rivibacter subsaxonicus]